MKQRLIDANEVLLTDKERKLCMFDAGMAFLHQEAKIIEAPTVEAIPIEWIDNYLSKWKNAETHDVAKTWWLIMKRDWEKENE